MVAAGACALVASLFATALSLPQQPASAQVWETPSDPAELLDDDLLHAVRRLGLESWWIDTSGVDPSVAFVRVQQDTNRDAVQHELRAQLFDLAASVISDQAHAAVAGLRIRSTEVVRDGLSGDLDTLEIRSEGIEERRKASRAQATELESAIERSAYLLRQESMATMGSIGAIEARLDRDMALGADLDAAGAAQESATNALGRLGSAAEAVEADLLSTDELIEQYRTQIQELAVRRGELRESARPVAAALITLRAEQFVAAVDLPLVVLDAYVSAGRVGASCGVDWALLGGIGWIESHHGTYTGGTVLANGELSRDILGIRLDGTNSAVITDTDNGRLDGDTAYDRAVGPMQFIPSTWARHARDGDNDGLSDPQNLHDAAATAATYLCRVGGDGASTRTRVLGYNRSNAYVDDVFATAAALRSHRLPELSGSR